MIKNRNKYIKAFLGLLAIACMIAGSRLHTHAAAADNATQMAQTYDAVETSPDGLAWTIPGARGSAERLQTGTRIETGQPSSLRELNEGEHYYKEVRAGTVNIGYWQMEWYNAQCVHGGIYEGNDYHGITGGPICYADYDNGWFAYCADCGDKIAHIYIYARSDVLKDIKTMPGTSHYYYLCPYSGSIEQGVGYEHRCSKISYNRYVVKYQRNIPEGQAVTGNMGNTYHMYDNAAFYEGASTTYTDRKLRKNMYSCTGYRFIGWNTKADGSGTWYSDGQEVLNLTTQNDEIIDLFAQWKKVETTLEIDANGGTYAGEEIFRVTKSFHEKYFLLSNLVSPAAGYHISFDSNGGSACEDILTAKKFSHWQPSGSFQGTLKDNIYTFSSTVEGNVDVVTVMYQDRPITLPTPTKNNISFGGWYYDEQLQDFCGQGGDEVTFSQDTKLYAKWVPLALWSRDNYAVNGGKGAVDLWWEQRDNLEKAYKVYQYADVNGLLSGTDITKVNQTLGKSEWHLLGDTAATELPPININVSASGGKSTYEVPFTGYYTLTATGGSGGDYSAAIPGGNGGRVGATYWLKKGDIITMYGGTAANGAQGGTNGNGADGGSSTDAASKGGGAASEVYVTRKGTTTLLLTAGGGGGANASNPGGAGGEALSTSTSKKGASTEFGGAGGGYNGGTTVQSGYMQGDDLITEEFPYTGGIQTFTAPFSSEYILKVWGAQGNGTDSVIGPTGGKGGYATGTVTLNKGQTIYIVTGGQSGYNGGGIGVSAWGYIGGNGGGATHIATNTGLLSSLSANRSSVLIVAGGGGGGADYPGEDAHVGGAGGGLNGANGDTGYASEMEEISISNPTGGTQTAGGSGGYSKCYNDAASGNWVWSNGTSGSFGQGGNGSSGQYGGSAGGGGGGWFGGGGGAGTYSGGSGAGGSGYFGGVKNGSITAGVRAGNGHAAISYYDMVAGTATTGGTNYINTSFGCRESFSQAGVNDGNGRITLISGSIGYQEDTKMDGVSAPDLAAPEAVLTSGIHPATGKEAVSFAVVDEAAKRVKITWTAPEDKGTDYYHKAESYLIADNSFISASNVTKNTLVSGVKGYHYIVDGAAGTVVTTKNSAYTTVANVEVTYADVERYLHIAPIDVAGNLGDTSTIVIGSQDGTFPIPTNWPLYTRQISIDADEGLYPAAADKTYYVRCDNETPFQLSYQSYMNGGARVNYQITHSIFESQMEGAKSAQSVIITPLHSIQSGEIVTEGSDLGDFADDHSALQSSAYMRTVRSKGNKVLDTEKRFVLGEESNGKTIRVTPIAGVVTEDVSVYSDISADLNNSIYLIGDCTPPAIGGMENLGQIDLVDRELASGVTITLTADDTGSGVGGFYVVLTNVDNNVTETITSDDNATLSFDIIADKPLLHGDVTVEVHAIDNVGNERVESHDFTEFTLAVSLKRILSPHDPIFKGGESGLLSITTTGYVDRLEIDFPEILNDYDCEILYPTPHYRKDETVEFMIPLYTEESDNYTITVIAYKDDTSLEEHPKLAVLEVEGSILDDIRTRLR